VLDRGVPRWIALALLVACNPPLTDKQWCTKQQMAWESAYPAVPQTDDQRKAMVDACMATVEATHASGAFDRSVACFDKHIHGKGHALEEYLAYKRCEVETK
jgi:hypothetical protein